MNGMEVFALMMLVLFLFAIVVAVSKLHIVYKTLLIPAIIISSILSFFMLEAYLGKPDPTKYISADVIVYGQVVDKEESKIYILLSDLDEPLPAVYFETEYNTKLADALGEGQKKFKGKPFQLKAKGKGEGEGKEGEGKNGKGKEGKKEMSISLESTTFEVHNLPPLRLPKKD